MAVTDYSFWNPEDGDPEAEIKICGAHDEVPPNHPNYGKFYLEITAPNCTKRIRMILNPPTALKTESK